MSDNGRVLIAFDGDLKMDYDVTNVPICEILDTCGVHKEVYTKFLAHVKSKFSVLFDGKFEDGKWTTYQDGYSSSTLDWHMKFSEQIFSGSMVLGCLEKNKHQPQTCPMFDSGLLNIDDVQSCFKGGWKGDKFEVNTSFQCLGKRQTPKCLDGFSSLEENKSSVPSQEEPDSRLSNTVVVQAKVHPVSDDAEKNGILEKMDMLENTETNRMSLFRTDATLLSLGFVQMKLKERAQNVSSSDQNGPLSFKIWGKIVCSDKEDESDTADSVKEH